MKNMVVDRNKKVQRSKHLKSRGLMQYGLLKKSVELMIINQMQKKRKIKLK